MIWEPDPDYALPTKLKEVTISYNFVYPERVRRALIFAWIDGNVQVYAGKQFLVSKLISILKHRESHLAQT